MFHVQIVAYWALFLTQSIIFVMFYAQPVALRAMI
jgi:hypothetical protein